MRIAKRLTRSGRFESSSQRDGTRTFELYGYEYATITVPPSGRDFRIRGGAIEHRRFPSTDRLEDYLRQHARRMGGRFELVYALAPKHLEAVLGIIGVRT